MNGESARQDFKVAYDPADQQAVLSLVKDLIAMANAGGGEIVFGRSETEVVGMDDSQCKLVDSAQLANVVGKYASPATLHIEHEDHQLANGRVIRTIRIAAVEYPIVMAHDGNYAHRSPGMTQAAFRKGDVWTRHSSKTERMTYDDLRTWMERMRRSEREGVLSRITKIIDIPDGAEIQIVHSPSVPALDTPHRMLEYAAKRRAQKSSYVLSGDDLLELFIHRGELRNKISHDELRLVLASALRRTPTLFWWLTQLDGSPEAILFELAYCLAAADRDKSDAASSVIELAAIYGDDDQLQDLIAKLAGSRYQHFREAVQGWNGRAAQLEKLRGRVARAKHGQQVLRDMALDELERYATETAERCLEEGAGTARRLGEITRVIWSKQSAYAARLKIEA